MIPARLPGNYYVPSRCTKMYEIFSTTADIGLRIWGDDCGDICRQAIDAFNEMVFGPDRAEMIAVASWRFAYWGDSCENLVVNFLLELVYLVFEKHKMVTGMNAIQNGEQFLEAELNLAEWPCDPLLEIKSVTYHNLKLEVDGEKKKLEVVLDI